MKLPVQLPVSGLLSQCAKMAKTWHVRLALTLTDDGIWVARSLVIDVFPQRWLENPDGIFIKTEYSPPRFLRYFPDRALMFAGMTDLHTVVGWFEHPEHCDVRGVDSSLSQMKALPIFRMPELYPDVSGMRLYSKRHDSYALLPWPHYNFNFTLKDADVYQHRDFEPLYAPGQGHFDNFREARAKLIHACSDLTSSNYQDRDAVEVRVVDADGWIRNVLKEGSTFHVSVGGLKLTPGYIIIKRSGTEIEEKELTELGSVSLKLPAALAPNESLDFILTNSSEELDRARYVASSSPVSGASSPHVFDLDEISLDDEPPASGTADASASAPLHPISLFPRGPFTRNDHLCFVLMPFAEELRTVYDEAIVPAATKAKLECQRADEITKPGGVMGQIWQALNEAQVVIADLTNMNPNVFYELGLAHAIGRKVILLTQDEQWVPFDLRHMRWFKYQPDKRGLSLLRQNLGTAIRAVLSETE